MAWLLILGLAVSSSIDNLGVGMSYGIRKIKISHASNMMIAFICFVTISAISYLFENPRHYYNITGYLSNVLVIVR